MTGPSPDPGRPGAGGGSGSPPWQPPPPKPKAPLILGILIGATAPFAGLAVPLVLSAVDAPSPLPDLAGVTPLLGVLAVLATGAGLLFPEDTRRWGLGILIGFFGMLIIGAGACVAVLVVVLSSYSGG